MSISNLKLSPYQTNLPLDTINLINQPILVTDVTTESETKYSDAPTSFVNSLNSKYQVGSGKSKKTIKKVKEIDMYKKDALEKIAKKHDISLKSRDGKIKTKEQLFKSLKRKDLFKKKMKGGEEYKEEDNNNIMNDEEYLDVILTDKYNIIDKNDYIIFSEIKFIIKKDDFKKNNNNLNLKKIMNSVKDKDEEMYKNIKNYINYNNVM